MRCRDPSRRTLSFFVVSRYVVTTPPHSTPPKRLQLLLTLQSVSLLLPPRALDRPVPTTRAESSRSSEGPAPSRTGFHYSEKYCPATGPERPPPRQVLLTASFKLTRMLTPSLSRFGGGAGVDYCTGTTLSSPGPDGKRGAAAGANGGGGEGGAEYGGGEANRRGNWSGSNGAGKPLAVPSVPGFAGGAGMAAAAAGAGAESTRAPPAFHRRLGTYERERQERRSVLHYLTSATAAQSEVFAAVSAEAGVGNATAAAKPNLSYPHGATAAGLMVAMREHPWGGTSSTGSPQDWAEWLRQLEPTLERHLRWLTVDGLAAQLNGDPNDPVGEGGEARFVALMPFAGDGVGGAEPGGKKSAGRLGTPPTGGNAVAAGGAGGPGAGLTSAAGLSMLPGGVRIMKSRPIKMVKPWR